jgi:hypothetical protein
MNLGKQNDVQFDTEGVVNQIWIAKPEAWTSKPGGEAN